MSKVATGVYAVPADDATAYVVWSGAARVKGTFELPCEDGPDAVDLLPREGAAAEISAGAGAPEVAHEHQGARAPHARDRPKSPDARNSEG